MNLHAVHRLFFCLFFGLCPLACNSNAGGGSSGASAQAGTLKISVTDAASEQIDRFEVDIKAIDLVKKNGAVVHALPITTRVDFAELVDVAEMLNATSVPVGSYIQAEMTLDFATASVHIAGLGSPAQVLGDDGLPLTGVLTVKIQLDSQRPLVVAPGLTKLLTLDFDLDASTSVDVAGNKVTISPVMVADIDLERPRVHRVRGPLELVDVDSGSFFIDLRPFRLKESKFGSLRIFGATDTLFEVNGIPQMGLSGLQALAALPAFTGVIAEGGFRQDGIFIATIVVAGSGVPGGTLDVVRGHVTSRSGNDLTLAGAELDRSAGSVTFNSTALVKVNPGTTRVTREFSTAGLTTEDISVGQNIVAFGTLAGGPGSFVLDPATHVRLIRTKLTGKVKSLAAGGLIMEVQLIGLRPPSAFNFAGTGAGGIPADPADYQVVTGDINLAGLTAGSPIRLFGFVNRFGVAPPDFIARTLVDVSGVGALLDVAWKAGTSAQFKELSADQMVLDFTDSPQVHHVIRALAVTDVSTLAKVSVAPASSDPGFYVLAEGGTVTVFKGFSAFIDQVKLRLGAGKRARRLCSLGHFDDSTGKMSSVVISLVVGPGA